MNRDTKRLKNRRRKDAPHVPPKEWMWRLANGTADDSGLARAWFRRKRIKMNDGRD